MHEPGRIYSQRLAECRADVAARERRHATFGYLQLASVICALGGVWLALVNRAFSIVWVTLPAAVFVTLFVIHDRLLEIAELRRRAARFFERGLARLEGHWAGTGEAGDSFLDPAHPYAQDLDLFGKGSLFELLCTARTRIGAETLARWLLTPADPVTVKARQEAVEELRPRMDLREDLAVVAEEAHTVSTCARHDGGVEGIGLVRLVGPGHHEHVPVTRQLAERLEQLGIALFGDEASHCAHHDGVVVEDVEGRAERPASASLTLRSAASRATCGSRIRVRCVPGTRIFVTSDERWRQTRSTSNKW